MKLEKLISEIVEDKSDELITEGFREDGPAEKDINFTHDKSWQKKASKSLNTELKKIIGVDPQIKISMGKYGQCDWLRCDIELNGADIASSMKPKMYKKLSVEKEVEPARYSGGRSCGSCFYIADNLMKISVRYEHIHFKRGNQVGPLIGIFFLDSSGKIVKRKLDIK